MKKVKKECPICGLKRKLNRKCDTCGKEVCSECINDNDICLDCSADEMGDFN